MNDTQRQLGRIADDLLDAADLLPDAEARALRRASYLIDDVKTSRAVGELMQVAGHQQGMTGPIGFRVIREREVSRV